MTAPLPVRILGAGVQAPGLAVTSAAIDARLGRAPGWSERSTGVRTRRYAAEGETASVLGAQAACKAIAMAGIEPAGLSAIVGACGVMEQPIPGTATLIHRRLGLEASGVAALDVNAVCLSFLAALRWASLEIANGTWSRVLIVAADLASAALPEDDPAVTPLFGDGAAAVVLGRAAPGDPSALLAWRMETHSEGAEAAWLGAGGSRLPARNLEALLAESRFRMDGPAAYRLAAAHMPAFFEALLGDAGWQPADVDWFVPHQASGQGLAMMARRLGVSRDRVIDILADHGNQVAASMPTALAEGIADGRIGRGDRLLLLGSGAGVSLGGAALVY